MAPSLNRTFSGYASGIQSQHPTIPPILLESFDLMHAFVQDGCEKIDSAIAIKEQQIATLREYRASLINDAVTGTICVA